MKLTIVHDRLFKNGLPHNSGGATYVFDKTQPVEFDKSGSFCVIKFGVAFCRCDDNFNRAIGRYIATGRIKETVFEHLTNNKYLCVIGDYEFIASVENSLVKFITSRRLRDGELNLKQFSDSKTQSV